MLTLDGIIYSLQNSGGISVYFTELVNRLFLDGVASRMLVYNNTSRHSAILPGNSVSRVLRYAERYRRCSIGYTTNLFHSSYYRLPEGKVPTVTTVHDFTYERFVRGPRLWVHSWQKFAAIRGAQEIICISENTKRDLLNYLPDIHEERVHVIPNGVSEDFFPINRGLVDNKNRPFVLFVGARGGYKNFIPLIHALKNFPDLGLACVGGGRMTTNECTLVQKHLSNRFKHFVGPTNQELNALYNQAYCLVYPSSYEGFGIPIIEAMRAGCPVVAMNNSSIPEVAGDAALLLPQATSETLTAALKKLSEPSCREILRDKGFSHARKFSWDLTYQETKKIYKLVTGLNL